MVPRPQLLVSVRDAVEAVAAWNAGAELIDIKDPERGSLGRPDRQLVEKIAEVLPPSTPLSVALGDWSDDDGDWPPYVSNRLTFIKWGLADQAGRPWQAALRRARSAFGASDRPHWVLAAYADAKVAKAPEIGLVIEEVIHGHWSGLLLDTFHKGANDLLGHCSIAELRQWIEQLHHAGKWIALAGGLTQASITRLLPLRPDWFAVRGAVCWNHQRRMFLDPNRVAALRRCLDLEPELCPIPC